MKRVLAIICFIAIVVAAVLAVIFLKGSTNLFAQDLVALIMGIPVMLVMIALLGLIIYLWRYTVGKIIIIAGIILIIIIGIIF